MIILIRHALPDIDYSRCCAETAVARLKEYNFSEKLYLGRLASLKNELSSLVLNKGKPIIFTSNLSRAIITAQYLFDSSKFDINTDPIFAELDLAIMKIPFVQFSLKNWLVVSRIAWCLGLHQEAQSFWKERRRAKNAMHLLKPDDKQGQITVLVGHQFINLWIRIYLKREGWVVQRDKRYGDVDVLLPG